MNLLVAGNRSVAPPMGSLASTPAGEARGPARPVGNALAPSVEARKLGPARRMTGRGDRRSIDAFDLAATSPPVR